MLLRQLFLRAAILGCGLKCGLHLRVRGAASERYDEEGEAEWKMEDVFSYHIETRNLYQEL
jgi:hypothetical protein